MSRLLDDLDPRAALVEVARDFHGRGWMAGTAGNLSVRIDAESFWITASGHPKGRLDAGDFARVAVAGDAVLERSRPQERPSAETAIHSVIYRLFADARACLHVHTVDACLATSRAPAAAGELALPPLEMVKGFDIWEQDPCVGLPVFDNLLEVPHIAAAIEARFKATPPRLTALMIRGHGVTVWGRSLQEAYNRTEIIEFILAYTARAPA